MINRPAPSAANLIARTMHSLLRFLSALLVALPLVANGWTPLYITGTGTPCTWPQPATITLVGSFGAKADPEATTWNTVAAEAMASWNANMANAQLVVSAGTGTTGTRENRINEMFFADTAFGLDFGSAVALTSSTRSGDRFVESDIVFASNHGWDIAGFRATATHELGHVLGLGHPDQAGQTVVALMNGNSVNSLTLAADDITGAQALYGAPPPPRSIPVITTQPASRAVLLGGSASFTVTASGFPVPTFQWQRNGIPLPGATAATLTLYPVSASDAGQYRAVATNTEGSATSAAAALTVNSPPFIVAAPIARILPVGDTVTFTVVASSDAPLSYQWAFNGTDIPGATAQSHAVTVSALTVGTYRVMVSNVYGSASASATLAIRPPFSAPVITTQPLAQTVNAGTTATLVVEATGYPLPVCQWQKNGVDLPGALGFTLALENVQASHTGNYRAVLTNSSGSVTSETVTLIVNTQAAAITTQPVAQTAIEGRSASLTVGATGFPAPTFQWKKGGKMLAGATGATLTFPKVQLTDAGLYSVVVTNAYGTETSAAVALVVNRATAAPVITVQPPSRTVSLGGSVSIAVVATGYPAPTFQWYKNGITVSGASASSLVLSNAQESDAGAYTVAVANASGSILSSVATLTVSTAPAAPRISAEPLSQASPTGATVSFIVVADGNPTLSYQWRKDGSAIPGATGPSLVIPGVQTGAAGDYTVVVSNTLGTRTSAVATLVVNTPPVIVTQPIPQTVAAGSTAVFSVGATGVPAPSYQWRKSGVDIEGATDATLTIANAQPDNAGNYLVIVTNSSGLSMSNAVALTVNTGPSIATEPADLSVLVGTLVDFAVVAQGTQPLIYQWYMNGALAADHTAASFGAFAAEGYHDGFTFKCVVTNALGFVTSRTATLHVGVPSAPSVITQPADVIAQIGTSVDFSVEASGIPTPTYQWYLNGVLAAGHAEADFGAFVVDGFHDGYTFRCVITNASGTVSTRIARLTVGALSAPVVLVEPADLEAKIGDSVDFVAAFSGLPTPTYQWYLNGSPVDGRNSARFGAFTAEAYHNGATFYCVATNTSGSVSSRHATLRVARPAAPVFTTHPANRIARVGARVDFETVATGYPTPTYQWYLNGVLEAGHNAARFGGFTVEGYHNGFTFTCVATNSQGSVTSQTATLTVADPPVIGAQSETIGVSAGQPASLSITATGATSYQWAKGGVIIAGATGATLRIPTMRPVDAGLYDCIATGPGGDTLSAPVVVGLVPASGQRTAGSVVTQDGWQNISHSSGTVFDQFLLSGEAGSFTADPGQVARMSFLDENGSIVQVELSGAGAITVVLQRAAGPMAPTLYNQTGVLYMKGKATVILAGADESTHFTIYSVGTATNPGVTRSDADYVGWANVAAAGIVSANGKLGGIHQGNVSYSADLGPSGLYAPAVASVGGLVAVHEITASAVAQPYLRFAAGGTVNVRIAGGSLIQPSLEPVIVAGLSRVTMGAGQDSCGRAAPARAIQTLLYDLAGVDVTAALVVGP